MHYANGRYAQESDPVVVEYNGKPTVGVIHTLNANAMSCNASLAVAIPGGTTQLYVSINECWHAEDALDLLMGRGAKGYGVPASPPEAAQPPTEPYPQPAAFGGAS